MTKALVGIRPTGRLHLGHYFSVIKPALKYKADVLIADLHAPDNIESLENFETELRKYGLENIICQSVNELVYFQLLNLASFGDLERMTQFKSAKRRNPHLFCYPVLMTCDLIGYDRVIVGEDQKQHIEFARDLAKKYKKRHGFSLKMPKPVFVPKVMDLKNPEKKMSKSEPNTCLFLHDRPEEIRRKIMGAVTTREGLKNLSFLYKEFMGRKFPEKECLKGKEKLIEAIIEAFETTNYLNDPI